MLPTGPRRLLNAAALAASIVFLAVICLWVVASRLDPRKQFISPGNSFHISIDARGLDARLELFSDSTYGPYSGSIMSVGDRITGFGDTWGIYFRWITSRQGMKMWMLSLSLAYPLTTSAVLPVAWWLTRSRDRKRSGFPIDSVPKQHIVDNSILSQRRLVR